MKKSYFLAIAMLSIVISVCISCVPDEEVVPKPLPTDTLKVSFAVSNEIKTSMTTDYSLVRNEERVVIFDEFDVSILSFTMKPGSTRVFTGDTAELILGKRMTVRPVVYIVNILYPNSPAFPTWSEPASPVVAVVEKDNVYNFDVYFQADK